MKRLMYNVTFRVHDYSRDNIGSAVRIKRRHVKAAT